MTPRLAGCDGGDVSPGGGGLGGGGDEGAQTSVVPLAVDADELFPAASWALTRRVYVVLQVSPDSVTLVPVTSVEYSPPTETR